MSLQNSIHDKLASAFSPTHLDVINDSHKHQGHAGSPGTGESHFTLKISAPALEGLSRVKAHQEIYRILEDEFQKGLHALSIKIL